MTVLKIDNIVQWEPSKKIIDKSTLKISHYDMRNISTRIVVSLLFVKLGDAVK